MTTLIIDALLRPFHSRQPSSPSVYHFLCHQRHSLSGLSSYLAHFWPVLFFVTSQKSHLFKKLLSWGNSISIVSEYLLGDRGSNPAGARKFSFSPCVQTGSGGHRASYTVGTGGSFRGGKARMGRDAGHSPPSSAKFKKGLELYLMSPKAPPRRVAW
jgi:hypothetical protein